MRRGKSRLFRFGSGICFLDGNVVYFCRCVSRGWVSRLVFLVERDFFRDFVIFSFRNFVRKFLDLGIFG